MLRIKISLVLITLYLFGICIPVLAQDTLWTKKYIPGMAVDVQLTKDDGFIIGSNVITHEDVYFIKTDSVGNTIWISAIGGGYYHRINAICQKDSFYIAAGTSTPSYLSQMDFWLVCISDEGDTLWSRTYGEEKSEYAYCMDATADNGYVIAGTQYISYDPWNEDFFVVKTTAEGDTQWTKTYGYSGADYANAIQQASDGGYIIAGYRGGLEAAYLLKTDASGNEEWHVFEMEGWPSIFYSVEQTSDGGYIAAGSKESSGYPSNLYLYYLVKYDTLGNKEWERTYENGIFIDSGAWDVCQTIDGGYLIAGYGYIPYERGASRVIRTDPQGDTLWTWRCDEPDYSNALLSFSAINEQEFVAAGYYDDSVWLVKFQEPSYCCEVDMIPDDDPVVVQPGGSFGYTGSLINPTEEFLAFDVWVGVIYEDQFFQTRLFEGNEPLEPGEFLTRHFRQNVPNYAPVGDYRYIAYGGNYPSKCDSVWFDFTVEGAPLADGSREWSVQELFTNADEDVLAGLPRTIQIDNSPNPFNATTTITYRLPEAGSVNIAIYNLSGQKIALLVDGMKSAGEHSVTWDASEYSSGVYFYKLEIGDRVITKRMTLLK